MTRELGVLPQTAAEALRDLSSKYPEVDGNIVHFKFKGRGQRETPVTGARGVIDPWSASVPCASISRNDKRAPRDFGGGANPATENKLGRRAARSVYAFQIYVFLVFSEFIISLVFWYS